jgi:hypothetical protein
MAVEPATQRSISQLSERELGALVEAAAWYAKYHERSVSGTIGDDSATAHVRREHFRDLHSALWQLGVRLRLPDGLGHS